MAVVSIWTTALAGEIRYHRTSGRYELDDAVAVDAGIGCFNLARAQDTNVERRQLA
jgi:hypothetical protein